MQTPRQPAFCAPHSALTLETLEVRADRYLEGRRQSREVLGPGHQHRRVTLQGVGGICWEVGDESSPVAGFQTLEGVSFPMPSSSGLGWSELTLGHPKCGPNGQKGWEGAGAHR